MFRENYSKKIFTLKNLSYVHYLSSFFISDTVLRKGIPKYLSFSYLSPKLLNRSL